MLPIAVEIAPLDAHRDEVQVLLAACTRAAAEAECVLASEAPPGGAAAVAIVTWQSESQAFVEVGMRRDGRPEWRSRTVNFAANDEVVERWRTLGFVVGTLARNELVGEPNPEPPPASDQPPKAPPPAPPPPPVVERPAPAEKATKKPGAALAAIDLGAEFGPGLDSGLRSGGVLRTRFPLQEPLRALMSLKYMEQNGSPPDGRWFTLGAGLAWAHGSPRAEISVALEGRVERFEAKYERLDVTAPVITEGATSIWLTGVGTHVNAVWMAMPTLGLYVGADAAWMFGRTRIHIISLSGSERVIMDGPLRLGAGAGIRLRLW
jgi:hypothetical protein